MLSIDAESVFQIISVLFYPSPIEGPHGPYELLQMGRLSDDPAGNLPVQVPKDDTAHWRFIKVLDTYCIHPKTPENVKFQYYYFVAKVIARSPAFEGYDHNYFFFVLKELLQNFKKYLDFVRKLYEQSLRCKRIKAMEASGEVVDEDSVRMAVLGLSGRERERDNERVVRKVERDLILLIKKSEPMDKFMTEQIVSLAEKTNFNKVKTDLLERKEQFLESLRTLL